MALLWRLYGRTWLTRVGFCSRDGNSCLAAGHDHATGDSLVGNLKAARLVSAESVSKDGARYDTDEVR
jgi:hypothetical protein